MMQSSRSTKSLKKTDQREKRGGPRSSTSTASDSYYINAGSSHQLKPMAANQYKEVRRPFILSRKSTENLKNQSQMIFYPSSRM